MPATVKVFIAGSRALSRLNDALRQRLGRIVEEGHDVLVGDASGENALTACAARPVP